MIRSIDVIAFAARNGITLDPAKVKSALALVDRESLENTERARYTAVVWDGKGQPPIGTADRWLHGDDGSSRSAIESINNGGVVYFLMKDGRLRFWQPHRADVAGRIHMVNDPSHRDHWETAASEHIASEVEAAVDQEVTRLVIDAALA